jgi:hypothetical protein
VTFKFGAAAADAAGPPPQGLIPNMALASRDRTWTAAVTRKLLRAATIMIAGHIVHWQRHGATVTFNGKSLWHTGSLLFTVVALPITKKESRN